MKLPLIVALSTSLSSWSLAAYDIEPLTYNVNLWQESPRQLVVSFPELKWKESDNSISSSLEGLELWGKKVETVSVYATEENTTTQIALSLLSEEDLEDLKSQDFTLVATQWKQMLDKKLGSSGTRRPTESKDGQKISKVAWKNNNSVIVLSAVRSDTPAALRLHIFETKTGMASLSAAPKANPPGKEKDPSGGSSGSESIILGQLKGTTSFLAGSKFKKEDIDGDPDFFLLYFSASW